MGIELDPDSSAIGWTFRYFRPRRAIHLLFHALFAWAGITVASGKTCSQQPIIYNADKLNF